MIYSFYSLKEQLFQHPIEVISFIAPDINDGRAFGYVVSIEDSNKYIGIRTERAALQVRKHFIFPNKIYSI